MISLGLLGNTLVSPPEELEEVAEEREVSGSLA